MAFEPLGANIPPHFSRLYPQYKMTSVQATLTETLTEARKIALEEESIMYTLKMCQGMRVDTPTARDVTRHWLGCGDMGLLNGIYVRT